MSIDNIKMTEWDSLRNDYGKAPLHFDHDMVNKPPHYNKGDIECIDGIKAMLSEEEYIGYLRGNSLKYRWRYPYKNGLEDLKKAEWYEKKLLEIYNEKEIGS
jgi:hypothetical protein